MEEKGFTIWFTGLSGAGKSTIAQLVRQGLKERDIKVELLDGDIVRTNLSKGLGFSKEDRDANIRRIAFVCHLLSRNNVGAIAAAISPYRAIRDEAREDAARRELDELKRQFLPETITPPPIPEEREIQVATA